MDGCTGRAPDIEAAVRRAERAASAVAMIVSFCVNAVVEPSAFNASEGLSRREFAEVFLPDETGLLRPGRWVDAENLYAFGLAAYSSAEAQRLFRALAQYQAALRYWTTGSQVLAMHLYIACEVLTKAVLRHHQARLGLTDQEHARLLGVDVTQSNWKMMAGNFARRSTFSRATG